MLVEVVPRLKGDDVRVRKHDKRDRTSPAHLGQARPAVHKDIKFFERVLFSGGRSWAWSQASGVVLEIAVGTGRNLEYYPPIAQQRALALGRQADLRVGDAQALDISDESVDTVISTLALCSIPDDRKAVSEVKRVLRPGGRFILMEHVASPLRLV